MAVICIPYRKENRVHFTGIENLTIHQGLPRDWQAARNILDVSQHFLDSSGE